VTLKIDTAWARHAKSKEIVKGKRGGNLPALMGQTSWRYRPNDIY